MFGDEILKTGAFIDIQYIHTSCIIYINNFPGALFNDIINDDSTNFRSCSRILYLFHLYIRYQCMREIDFKLCIISCINSWI